MKNTLKLLSVSTLALMLSAANCDEVDWQNIEGRVNAPDIHQDYEHGVVFLPIHRNGLSFSSQTPEQIDFVFAHPDPNADIQLKVLHNAARVRSFDNLGSVTELLEPARDILIDSRPDLWGVDTLMIRGREFRLYAGSIDLSDERYWQDEDAYMRPEGVNRRHISFYLTDGEQPLVPVLPNNFYNENDEGRWAEGWEPCFSQEGFEDDPFGLIYDCALEDAPEIVILD